MNEQAGGPQPGDAQGNGAQSVPGSPPTGASGSDLSEADAKRLEEEEAAAYAKASREAKAPTMALLRYIDKDLATDDFHIPRSPDPRIELIYIAGVIEQKRAAQDTRHRRKLVGGVAIFTSVWILIVLLILFFQATAAYHGGRHPEHPWFHLSNSVMLALVGSTTGNVLGLAVIVLRGMFNRDPPDHVVNPADAPVTD